MLLIMLSAGCAKPMVEGQVSTTEPVTKKIFAGANAAYYGIKWAMDEMGYPPGPEDLDGGVVETKWVSIGPDSHYVDTFDRREYNAIGAYYKMIVRIVPQGDGTCEVTAHTKVQSVVNSVKSTGDKETKLLALVAEHARGDNVTVTNLGLEE